MRKLVMIAAVALLASCQMPTDSEGGPTRDLDLVGRFEGHGVYYVFEADGSFENGPLDSSGGDISEGEWETSGDRLTVVDGAISMTLPYAVENDELTLYFGDGDVISYSRQ